MAEKKKNKEEAGKSYGVLGMAKNPMEEEIAEKILPLLTPEDEQRIKANKLTLTGCMDKCMQNGRKYEVKSGNKGIARITEEQHWNWVYSYYGIKVKTPTDRSSVRVPETSTLDPFASLLDF